MKHAIEVFHTAQGDVAHHHRVAGVLVGASDLTVLVDADVLQIYKAVHCGSRVIVWIYIRTSLIIHTHINRVALAVRVGRLHRKADGNQVSAGLISRRGSGIIPVGSRDKSIDHIALSVRQIAVPELKVAHPGQG